VLLGFGGYAASGLGSLLTNRFSVPGSDAERGLNLLKARFHERGDGAFTLLVQRRGGGSAAEPAFISAAQAAGARAARAVRGGRAGPVQIAGPALAYMQIQTPLENADAADRVPAMRRAVGAPPGARTYLTGFPAINHDVQPIYNNDLGRGEAIAAPIALLVLIFMFGALGGIVVPILFAAVSIPTTLGFVWIAAHLMDMAVYVQNIVTLIGLAIAIDYSMLIVFRYREELARGRPPEVALERTMATAGRATIFSGLTVAVGLALLAFMPLPFMQSMGVGGLLVPLVSIAASATFLPALLSVLGPGVNRFRVPFMRGVLARRAAGEGGAWTRLAHSIMRRPWRYAIGAGAVMLALAAPAVGLHLNGAGNSTVPPGTEAGDGQHLLERALGPGALAPNQIAIDYGRPGSALAPASVRAAQRLVGSLRRDPEVQARTVLSPVGLPVARAQAANLLDPTAQVAQVRAAGHREAGAPGSVDLVRRIRHDYVPAAGMPPGTRVYVTGAPAFGVDFEATAYGAFPWLIVAVLVVSYLLLLRAFRSVILPAKAVLMNLLSVGATYGVLVLVFQHGIGKAIGLTSTPQIEAWIPIFLFAMLFGLSMDYEVFLLSRMREEWDARRDNERAVAFGLEHTGRIITAAAIIMIAAFSGFLAGSFVGLQEFGLGLAAAILLDATVVRALLVPAAMKLLGGWNWWLPERVRRVMRLTPSST
jgi:RND superfamily putative drug exporter